MTRKMKKTLCICGRALRAGAVPSGRVDSPWTTTARCPPPDHTPAPLAHRTHRVCCHERGLPQNQPILRSCAMTVWILHGLITFLVWLPNALDSVRERWRQHEPQNRQWRKTP